VPAARRLFEAVRRLPTWTRWARRPGDYSDRYYVRFDAGDRVDAFGWYNEIE